jgi:flagellar protein FliO/FliZ
MRTVSTVVLQFFPWLLWAGESRFGTSNGVVSFQDVAGWIASLILVLAIFLFCVWVIRKSQHWLKAPAQQLKIVTGLALGMREKLVLVQVGNKQILLGVTPGRIDKLLVLEDDERIDTDGAETTLEPFAQKLAQVMKKGD